MTEGEAVELHELLLQLGFGPVKAQLWSEFLKHVLVIFKQAQEELRQPDTWGEFKKKRGALGRKHVRRREKITKRYPNEDAITTELGEIVQTLRRSLPLGHFLRANEVEFHVERPVRSAVRAGRHSRKVDFFVLAASGANTPELALEAKTVRIPSDISNRYFGCDGIGCFLESESPYSQEPLGGMLAYSFTDSSASWRHEIESALEEGCYPAIWLRCVQIGAEEEPTLVSGHDRTEIGLEPMAIAHLEMSFDPDIQPFQDAMAGSGQTQVAERGGGGSGKT